MANTHVKMTTSLRKKLCNVSNKECILIEFMNDEKKYAIAYKSWVKGNVDLTAAELENNEVTVYWPDNVQVKYSRLLVEQLKTCKFSEKLAIIKGQGEWPMLSEQLKNLKKLGRMNVSKASRKQVAKKVSSPKSNDGNQVKHSKEKKKPGKLSKNEVQSKKNSKLLEAVSRKEETVERESDSHESDSDGSDDDRDSVPEVVLDLVNNDEDLSNNFRLGSPPLNKRSRFDLPSLGNISTPIRVVDEINIENQPSNSTTGTINETTCGLKRTFPLHPRVLKNLPKDSTTNFISGMCNNFFSQEYLSKHSATGKTTNVNPNASVRPPVDVPTIQYIKEKVEEYFGSVDRLDSLINKILGKKIAAARAKENKKRQEQAKKQ